MTKFNANVAHIVYASDDRFAEILGVSLVSLFENSKDMDGINVYILDSGISEKNKQKLLLVCKSYNRFGTFIPATDIRKKMSMEVSFDRGSVSQYARLFISSDLPAELNRVLYLDCDVIVIKSIKELWNLNLQGKTVGALMDAFSKHYRANIDLKSNDIMFNSGVMVINLGKWREQQIEKRLLEFIKAKNGLIQQGDQGALNAVLSKDVYCFDPCFNSVTIYFDFSYNELLIYRKPPIFYSKNKIKKAFEKPKIVHFTTSFLSKRPWLEGCCHPYAKEWIKYKDMSPWKNCLPWRDIRKKYIKIAYIIARYIPRNIMCHSYGILQAYIRPGIYYIKSILMKGI